MLSGGQGRKSTGRCMACATNLYPPLILFMLSYWLSTDRMTVFADTANGKITDASPIISRFIGQEYARLESWLKLQSGFISHILSLVNPMQTITITLSVPDGIQVQVGGNVVSNVPPADTYLINPGTSAGPTIEDLKRAFIAAVTREKKDNKDAPAALSFAALGCAKCGDVEPALYATVIEKLNVVAAG